MTFLPIVERELRVAARRRGTWWKRVTAAMVALAVGGWIMLMPFFRSQQALGSALFTVLAVISMIYSLMVGVGSAADCLSVEKRENTLGLLFLTDLKGYDVVLGKLAATSLNALYGLLAIFPILAISLLAGGVSGAEFSRVVVVCLNNMFLSLAAGMFCSAVCRDERRAAGLTIAILCVLTFLVPGLGELIENRYSREVGTWFAALSPGYAAMFAFDKMSFGIPPAARSFTFYTSVLCVHAMAWLLLVLACRIVPRSWQDKTEGPRRSRWREWWGRVIYGAPEVRRRIRARMLDVNPVYWLAGRDRLKAGLVWFFLAAIGLLWMYGTWRDPQAWTEESAFITIAFSLHLMLKIWVGVEASRRFALDRHSGALELILATPLSVREIVRGQLLALWKQFAAPVTVVLLVDVTFLIGGHRGGEHRALLWSAFMLVYVADLIALSWLGMWCGLRHRNVNRAAGAALWRILALPWVVFVVLVSLRISSANEVGLIFGWTLISLLCAICFGLWARDCLLSGFRKTVTERYGRTEGQGGRAFK